VQKLAEICVHRPVFATMLIMTFVVVGGFSYTTLGVDLFPKVDLPTITVTTLNPGASPREIETEITERIEAAVNTISGIDELRSTSVEGVSQVFITFALEKNPDIAAQEVREKVNLVTTDLPETAEVPTVQKLDPDAQAVIAIAVSAPRPLRDITDIAENQIKERIESVSGVGNVEIVGGQRREIQIMVDPDRLRGFGLSIPEVASALHNQNIELPGGRVDQGSRELTVRTLGKLTVPSEFREVVIATRNGYAVKIGDIATVLDAAEEQRTVSTYNGEAAVTLLVTKQSGTNTVAVADAVKERLAEIRTLLPGDVVTRVTRDQSIFIKASLAAINEHLIIGSLLASAVVFLFLWNWRSTVIASLAIPTSIIATFALMKYQGFTLNSMTMLSLTLMVGIVIDDAIVVLENIFRFVEEKGMPPVQAAIEGTKEIGLAVMATTLSLLAVFVPVGFMAGIVGRFMSSFGLTAAFAIAVSLIVSFTLTPALTARWIPAHRPGSGRNSRESRIYRPIDHGYAWLLHWSMRHRWVVVTLCVLVTLSIVPLFRYVGKNFLPLNDQAEFEIVVRAPEGSTLASTQNVVERIAADVRKLPGVAATLVTIGAGQQQIVNSGLVYVKLLPVEEREFSQFVVMGRARELLRAYPRELRTAVQPIAGISGGGFRNVDIQYVLSGPDLDKLTGYANRLLDGLRTVKDVVDADTSVIPGKPELRVVIDREKAADLGVRVADIASALNTLVAGQVVTTYNEGTEQYDVRLRARDEWRASREYVRRLTVPSSRGVPVGLENVVRFEEGTGPAAIDRFNRMRQVAVLANVVPGGSQAAILARLDGMRNDLDIEPGYRTGLAGRSRELGRAGYYFLLAFLLSFVFMYMILAAQFESFIHPVTILLTLPLAIPFGIVSLLVAGQTVNIFTGLGLLLLFGIVKKNAILQIDHTNTLRARGMPRYDAIIQANRDRLRPILMTTLALVAGMVPLVFGSGPGAATNQSIGTLVVGGQTLCLLLTLLAVPVFYSIFDDVKELRLLARLRAALVRRPVSQAE
jgi:HAE1 family hydrophobic/amphiphilic exporter-1